jgi:hypothetical protein
MAEVLDVNAQHYLNSTLFCFCSAGDRTQALILNPSPTLEIKSHYDAQAGVELLGLIESPASAL